MNSMSSVLHNLNNISKYKEATKSTLKNLIVAAIIADESNKKQTLQTQSTATGFISGTRLESKFRIQELEDSERCVEARAPPIAEDMFISSSSSLNSNTTKSEPSSEEKVLQLIQDDGSSMFSSESSSSQLSEDVQQVSSISGGGQECSHLKVDSAGGRSPSFLRKHSFCKPDYKPIRKVDIRRTHNNKEEEEGFKITIERRRSLYSNTHPIGELCCYCNYSLDKIQPTCSFNICGHLFHEDCVSEVANVKRWVFCPKCSSCKTK